MVDDVVVVVAEQGGVVGGGGSAVGPVDEVVGFGPFRWAGAGVEGAAAVAGHEGAPEGAGDGVGGAPDVEGFAVAAEDDGDDPGVEGEAAGGLGGDGPGPVERGGG